MSKTEDLDEAIQLVQAMLKKTKSAKLRLQIMDRLTKMLQLKYKFTDQRKGGKFTLIAGGKTDG
jgi:hypothetical protein